MRATTAVRWWPLVALVVLVVLGLALGNGSTPLDDWFHNIRYEHRHVTWLLLFTDLRVMVLAWAVVLGTAVFQRRWRLAAVIVVAPFVAVATARVAKRLFGRLNGADLAYPSGHTTLAVVILGMAVLVAGATMLSVVIAAVVTVLVMLGQGFTYHYFTDTVGAVFLGTALVCLAARAARLDRCQPLCDLRHSGR